MSWHQSQPVTPSLSAAPTQQRRCTLPLLLLALTEPRRHCSRNPGSFFQKQACCSAATVPTSLSWFPLVPTPETIKDKLLDTLHLGLFFGLVWGVIPLVGAVWILLFLAISTGVVYWVYSQRLKIDEEEYGGHGTLLQEGLFASYTLFLLGWILVYSLVHF